MALKTLPTATHESILKIGNAEIPCAVLQDGRRVLTQQGFLKAIGRARSAKGGQGSSVEVIPFLAAKNLQALVDDELRGKLSPLKFRTKGGRPAYAYPAETLPMVCDIYLRARDLNVLHDWQKDIAKQCDILLRGFATVGIIALVDEATGYQEARAKDALVKILEAFIAVELSKWAKTFPDDYYKHLFRLRNLSYSEFTTKRPPLIGKLTNDIVYERLAPGVLEELRTKNPKNEKGRRQSKHFQWLTSDVGHPALREHLASVVALMKVSTDYTMFKRLLQKALPKYTPQAKLLTIDDD